jgi:hypothetical protein
MEGSCFVCAGAPEGQQSFEIDCFEFMKMFGLSDGLYAQMGEFWHRDKSSFSSHSAWKTTDNGPGGNIRLAREER